MHNNYILGDNIVGYFLAYLLENTTLILHKTLEELDYNSGPKIIPVSLLPLVSKHFKDTKILEFERFYDDRGNSTTVMPKNFGKLYNSLLNKVDEITLLPNDYDCVVPHIFPIIF